MDLQSRESQFTPIRKMKWRKAGMRDRDREERRREREGGRGGNTNKLLFPRVSS